MFTARLWPGTFKFVYEADATACGVFLCPSSKVEEMYALCFMVMVMVMVMVMEGEREKEREREREKEKEREREILITVIFIGILPSGTHRKRLVAPVHAKLR